MEKDKKLKTQTKIGFILLLTAAALAMGTVSLHRLNKESGEIGTSRESDPRISSTNRYADAMLLAADSSRIAGQNSELTFERDLQHSLEKQVPPHLWIEMSAADGSRTRLGLGTEAEKILKRRWLTSLEISRFYNEHRDYESRLSSNKDYLNEGAISIQELSKIDIVTPAGRRKISEREATQLAALTAQFAIERFQELSKIDSVRQTPETVVASF